MAESKPATISACLIVKNEQTLLPRCLSSIRELVDEIILVDTGSEDRTLEIAGEYDCRIFHYPWKGDFAAARNESLERATGDWILVIDADEELPAGESDKIIQNIKTTKHNIIQLSVYNKSPETGRVSSFLPSIRLFRKKLGLRYQGIVHNRLSLPPDIPVIRSEIRLDHYGYDLSNEELKQKQARSKELLEKQLRNNPDDVYANFNMAQLLRGMGGAADPSTCRRIVMHAERVINRPDTASTGYHGYRLMAYIQTATALCTLNHYDEAERHCRDALAIKSDYIDAEITLANVCLAAAKLAEAEDHYCQYLTLIEDYKPENETDDVILHFLNARHIACYGLGTVAQMQGNIPKAIKYYNRVLEENNTYLDTCYRLGRLYLQQNQPRRAEELFRRQIEMDDASAAAYFGMGQAVIAQGRADHAISFLEKAVDLDPENARISFELGRTLVNLGQSGDGRKYLKNAVEKAPDDPDLHFECGNLLFEAGEIKEAMSLYEQAVALQPDNSDALNNLGNCYFRIEKYDKACSIFEQLIQKDPSYIKAYRNLGVACVHKGENQQALTALIKYVENTPGEIDILCMIGDLFLSLNYYSEAIGCYEKYLQRYPDDVSCLLNLSEGYFHLGHNEAAEMGYRRVLAADPSCQLAQKRLSLSSSPEIVE
jgi:tetratricopeptide (TPR) repeat protein